MILKTSRPRIYYVNFILTKLCLRFVGLWKKAKSDRWIFIDLKVATLTFTDIFVSLLQIFRPETRHKLTSNLVNSQRVNFQAKQSQFYGKPWRFNNFLRGPSKSSKSTIVLYGDVSFTNWRCCWKLKNLWCHFDSLVPKAICVSYAIHESIFLRSKATSRQLIQHAIIIQSFSQLGESIINQNIITLHIPAFYDINDKVVAVN